ncbi:hypothetical protein V8J82_07115 [Gymnodinialimonas sp. 2305UL16-5]|uniref:hypothetical protein n=1 Tax=Gymnodinialimonas mytili TaxID=3126503 RepID=UPI0030AF9E68
MTRTLSLPDFAQAGQNMTALTQPVQTPHSGATEEDTLAAFDRGYKSGWDDCAVAEEQERGAVGADLARTVADATLTYEAARRDVLIALGPLFEQIVSTLLPSMAAEAVAPAVIAEMTALAEGQTDSQVEVRAAPSICAKLQRIIEKQAMADLVIRPEPAFAEGQVSLRLGQERRDIDMADTVDRISQAISLFHDQLSDASGAQNDLN